MDAATVLLIRDGASGHLEVLLLERHRDADAFGGALVFPGGKVEASDRELADDRWAGPLLAYQAERLGLRRETDVLGLLVAGIRETFEEAGVLLARRADGTPLDRRDLQSPSFVQARRRLNARGAPYDWGPWLADEGLVLDLDAITPWSWWVTPSGRRSRFDTRFFVARLPTGQDATVDDVEATGMRWTTPAAALRAAERSEVSVVFPTRRNLQALMLHATAAEVVAAARTGRVDLRRIQPTIVEVGGRTMVRHPDGGPPEPI